MITTTMVIAFFCFVLSGWCAAFYYYKPNIQNDTILWYKDLEKERLIEDDRNHSVLMHTILFIYDDAKDKAAPTYAAREILLIGNDYLLCIRQKDNLFMYELKKVELHYCHKIFASDYRYEYLDAVFQGIELAVKHRYAHEDNNNNSL